MLVLVCTKEQIGEDDLIVDVVTDGRAQSNKGSKHVSDHILSIHFQLGELALRTYSCGSSRFRYRTTALQNFRRSFDKLV